MIRIDLHMHSTFSDGTMSPEELVSRGRAGGLSVMSLTDHDTLDGLAPFMSACDRLGVAGIPGVELSADHEKTLHILGYRLNFRAPGGLGEALERLRRGRDVRNERMCEKMQSMGVDITMQEVAAEAGGEVVARPHMARVLMKKGYSPDIRSAFERYLGSSAPAYVRRDRLPPADCIRLIREAGGLAVLAHPAQTTKDEQELLDILGRLKEAGLWGMECLSPGSSPEQVFRYMSMAAEFGLFATAGSDFHGANRPSVSMGVSVKEDFLPWARLGVSLSHPRRR